MGGTFLNLLYINIFVVICIDRLKIDQPLKRLWWRWVMRGVPYRDFSAKPFDCSLCLSWWVGLAWLVFADHFTFANVILDLVLATFNFVINNALIVIEELLTLLMDIILCAISQKRK